MFTPETRAYRAFEVRALPSAEGSTAPSYRVTGYAATFEQETVLYEYDGIKYKEIIDRNAFSGAKMQDVVMNYNHGGKPVARTRNGTLTLTVDNKGLLVEADLSGTEEGRRLFEEIDGGYIDKMSFAFKIKSDSYDRAKHLRRLLSFEQIFDVAAVNFPAYESTSISARSWYSAEAERERAEAQKRKRINIKIDSVLGGNTHDEK